jgi:hypothetical protein
MGAVSVLEGSTHVAAGVPTSCMRVFATSNGVVAIAVRKEPTEAEIILTPIDEWPVSHNLCTLTFFGAAESGCDVRVTDIFCHVSSWSINK